MAKFNSRILTGDFEDLPLEDSNIVRIFISSTFGDFINERNRLVKETFPLLIQYCQSKGLEFQAVDMRWGVSDENVSYHQTSDVCMQEILNCQRLSVGPSFVVLLGDRYGYRPLPARIHPDEFSLFQDLCSHHNLDFSLLATWYCLDNNAVPPVHCLQPIISHFPQYSSSDSILRDRAQKRWWETFQKLQKLLWKLITIAKRRGKMTQDRAHIYCQSVTESEIHSGLTGLNDPDKHCLCYVRRIAGLHNNLMDNMASRYTDVDQSDPSLLNKEAQNLLDKLKNERVFPALSNSNIMKFDIPWKPGGIDPDQSDHRLYLEQLCRQFYADVIRLIDQALVNRAVKLPPLFLEVLHHARFCQSKCQSFCGQKDLLGKIKEFLKSKKRNPLIIYGKSGLGKTSVMAKAIYSVRNWLGPNCVTVVRFLGTTPNSSSIQDVLLSISSQLCEIYNIKTPDFNRMDYMEIVQYFRNEILEALRLSGKDKLVIFLDSIDQLTSANSAHAMNWLPKLLPPNVYIVISMLPEKHNCLKTLNSVLPNPECYIRLDDMPLCTGLEIFNVWLAEAGRTITPSQRAIITASFTKCPQPLFLKLLFRHASQWHSYTCTDSIVFGASTLEVLSQFYRDLERVYGEMLVQRALGYITAARSGLSESELEDVLSLDNDVLNGVYQYWDPPIDGVVRVPGLLWKRIYHSIREYVVEQQANGKTVLAWYHRQFVESATRRYLSDTYTKERLHTNLADLFNGTWTRKGKTVTLSHRHLTVEKANRQVPQQPLQFSEAIFNFRKLYELPYHFVLSGQVEQLKSKVLCCFEWLLVKLRGTDFVSVMEDYDLALSATEDEDISITAEALLLSASSLKLNADCLASQLLGRLCQWTSLSPIMNVFLKQAKHWSHSSSMCQLTPCNQCLICPGGPLKTTLSGHPRVVLGLSMCQSHSLVISASPGPNCNIFNVWDMESLQCVQNLHTFKVTKPGPLCFAVAQELLATISQHKVLLWHLKTGELVSELGSKNTVALTAVVTLSDCKTLVSGTEKGCLIWWDQYSGDQHVIAVHQKAVRHLSTAEIVDRLVTISEDGELRMIELSSRNVISESTGHGSPISCLHVSDVIVIPCAVTGSVDAIAKVWCLLTGKLLHTLYGHTKDIKCATTVASKLNIITGSLDKTLRLWDFTTGLCLRVLEGHVDGVWCLATLPSSSRVVSGSKDDYLKVWDISTGNCLYTLEGHSSWISSVLATSHDTIVSGSNDKTLKIWKLDKCNSPSIARHFTQPECITCARSGVVVSGAPDAIKVWDSSTGHCLHTFKTAASSLAVINDGYTLISGGKDCIINIWDLNTFFKVQSVTKHSKPITAIISAGAASFISAAADGSLLMWNLVGKDACICNTFIGHSAAIKCMTISKDASLILTGSYDLSVRIWCTKSARSLATFTAHTKVIWCVAISHDNLIIASGGDDHTMIIWDLSSQSCLHKIKYTDSIKCISFGLDNSTIIAGAHCSVDQLIAWDVKSGERIMNFIGHGHALMCMIVINSHFMVSGSRDGTVKVWNLKSGEQLTSFDLQSQVKHMSLLKQDDSLLLATTTKTGFIAILDLTLPFRVY